MKTLIYLIRHGETDWNKSYIIQGRYNKELNEKGRTQLYLTAENIKQKGLKFDVYLSSPLSRAIESCMIIKEVLNDSKEIIIRPNLIEREFGYAEGLIITDDVYERVMNDSYPMMETSDVVSKRALDEVLEIGKLYNGKTILATTHSHFIKALFILLDKNLTFKSHLSNGGLNLIEIEDGKITRFEFNK